jgi:hypothetical protein
MSLEETKLVLVNLKPLDYRVSRQKKLRHLVQTRDVCRIVLTWHYILYRSWPFGKLPNDRWRGREG